MPKAYVIVEIDVHDPETFARYRELSTAAAQQYGGRFIVRGGQTILLEGERPPARVVVLEFDDVASARRWWDSPEYEQAKAVRRAASSGSFLLVEGV